MYRLFTRLESTRKGVLGRRQLAILKLLLKTNPVSWEDLLVYTNREYADLKNPRRAAVRDVNNLQELGAVTVYLDEDNKETILIGVRLEWPTEITETEFFEHVKRLPHRKSYSILR